MSLAFIISCSGAVVAALLALLVGLNAKRSAAHWLFVAGMLILGFESLCVGLISDAVFPENVAFWTIWVLRAQALIAFPWLAFSLSYARGNPVANFRAARWQLLASLIIPLAVVFFLRSDLMIAILQDQKHSSWIVQWGFGGRIFAGVLLLLLVLIITNLERTFRASVGTMRWRIKYMILGLGILFVVRAYSTSQILLFPSTLVTYGIVNSAALLLGSLIAVRSLFRTGHFEVSVYPSQSLLANSLTVLVAGIYLVIVGLLAKFVSFFGGETDFALKALIVLLALVVLAVILLSDRVRLLTRQFVSRHLQRPVFDYRTVWEKLTQVTARCTEDRELSAAVSRLASEVFQCLSVSIWLLDERKENFQLAASTSLHGEKANEAALGGAEAQSVIQAVASLPDPIDIDASHESYAALLQKMQPGEFRKGGNRLCIPMKAAGELLGVMYVGDRVGGVTFSMQDRDLLKAVAGHAAASLLSLQLSRRLSQARQLEAFQAMSAFFVHDLKNTASTLSLMLKNFPIHYEDPAFREDALRGIAKTVNHINDLIGRLNLLRQHDLSIQPVEVDLNQLVMEVLQGQEHGGDVEIAKDLQPLPAVRVDPGQVRKVVTNLLLNSREAITGKGTIRISTSTRNGWAVLAFSDTGCGMTPEFMKSQLFRPFQTTKKRGIGIGMFHCKMIVEAHKGRIEVESEPGKGTTFQVLLPLATETHQ